MVLAAVYKYRLEALNYLLVFTVIMAVGMLFYRFDEKTVIFVIYEKIKNVFSLERKKK